MSFLEVCILWYPRRSRFHLLLLIYKPSVYPGDSNENKPLVGAEEEEVAKMGCPSLGEHTQVDVVIEESYEFKVSVCVHCNQCF